MKASGVYLALFLVFAIFGCGGVKNHSGSGQARDEVKISLTEAHVEVLRIANDYLSQKYPDVNVGNDDVRIFDKGDCWKVEFLPPKGSIGGGPEITIDKGTKQVTGVAFFQ